nr:immunoglobulin light chain junction region [Macaca mulatta]
DYHCSSTDSSDYHRVLF